MQGTKPMKRRASKKRSAIVPAMVFAAGLSVAAGVVPNIVGCDDNPMLGVAAQFGDMAQHVGLDVAAHAFDMSVSDLRETD